MLIPTPARALDDEPFSQTIHRGHAARRGAAAVAAAVAVASWEQSFGLACLPASRFLASFPPPSQPAIGKPTMAKPAGATLAGAALAGATPAIWKPAIWKPAGAAL